MSDDEDDYLSDTFLVEATSSASSSTSKTYAERRKEALKRSALQNEQNRKKSLKEREREAREEALNRSLFERAQEEAQESGQQNKALAMMMKMGFKPGQALGKEEDEARMRNAAWSVEGEEEEQPTPADLPRVQEKEAEPVRAGIGAHPAHDALEAVVKGTPAPAPAIVPSTSSHRKVPLAINEWEGARSAV